MFLFAPSSRYLQQQPSHPTASSRVASCTTVIKFIFRSCLPIDIYDMVSCQLQLRYEKSPVYGAPLTVPKKFPPLAGCQAV